MNQIRCAMRECLARMALQRGGGLAIVKDNKFKDFFLL